MHHTHDGICFERLPGGRVRISKRWETTHPDGSAHTGCDEIVVLSADEWVSVMTSMAYPPEDARTHLIFQVFHNPLADAPSVPPCRLCGKAGLHSHEIRHTPDPGRPPNPPSAHEEFEGEIRRHGAEVECRVDPPRADQVLEQDPPTGRT